MTKIFISGGPGSGKTTYAKELSVDMGIPHFDLDDLKWVSYNCERKKSERLQMLDKILSENDNWIIEGVYFKDWIIPILEQSDKIIIMNPSTFTRQCRIIKRSIKRWFGKEKYKESLASMFKLLVWSRQYNKYLPELLNKIEHTGKKAEFIR